MVDLISMEEEALQAYLAELKEPKFRSKQLFSWLHQKLATDYDQMTNLPASLRTRLAEEAPLSWPTEEKELVSKTDDSRKYLFRLEDGQTVESVLMGHNYGYSVCVSSQAGCGMGCVFCASTVGGFVRNLTAAEMLGQIYHIQRKLFKEGKRISHVVVMGTGEPLLNLENLLAFIRILSDEKGQHLSKRNFTVSTCGIVPGIEKLARENLPITLALSLHASTQEARERIMPIAQSYPLPEVLSACEEYFALIGRRVTYEYAMMAEKNDSEEDAKRLGILLKKGAHMNLIPLNKVEESSLSASSSGAIDRFVMALKRQGINATIRRSMGADIEGACGQLRRKTL